MTGRKDIPTIYVTYAPGEAQPAESLSVWREEREQLKKKILSAPGFRVNHILQDIDRQVNELLLISEAMCTFSAMGRSILAGIGKFVLVAGLAAFFLTDPLVKSFTGVPDETLISALLNGTAGPRHLWFPLIGVAMVCFLSWIWFSRWSFPGLIKKCQARKAGLVNLDSNYKKTLWAKVEGRVGVLLAQAKLVDLGGIHGRNLGRIRKFLAKDLQDYYTKIR
jgi:hypothetical protein